ncbi:MAG: excinuclease ABC subunit UvrA [Ignavibacteriaceae bacterium]|nr:excinuclease ABC subunit UvrA [Ignavibacteriaceae bacterium]
MSDKRKVREQKIVVKGARENNLKNIDVEIPAGKLVVVTGVSGSGKSSLVFDTIYAEGQRRYVESLSSYARQFLERIDKPDVDLITGISPAVSIEQKTVSRNTRSTVGTTTEVYDYLRLLYARIGKTHCFSCGKIVEKASTGTVCDYLESLEEGIRTYLGFPIHKHEGRSINEEVELVRKRGFFRLFFNNTLHDLNDDVTLPDTKENVYVVIERFKVQQGKVREKLADSIEVAFKEGENRVCVILADSGETKEFNKFYECCGIRYEEPEPRFFSFNNPFGACPVCQGFSKTYGFDLENIVPDPRLSILEGAIHPWRTPKFEHHTSQLVRIAKKYRIPVDVPFEKLTDDQILIIRKGADNYIGIDRFFEELEQQTYKMHIRIYLSKYRGYTTCNACKGTRLRREALQVKIDGLSIADLVKLPINKALKFFEDLNLTEYENMIAERILKEIIKRLTFLNDVGLSYLTLDRLSSTLSGGESQRINLATALGSALVGTLYVLDEPSIGLHPRDNTKLIKILKNLRDIGNSVLVVEHDSDMMKNADMIIDIGPHAGVNGGSIVAQGNYDEITGNPESLTGQYLSGKKRIPVFKSSDNMILLRELSNIRIIGARENNLKNIDVEIPLNKFVVITGVSGSGKSTLVHDVLYGTIAKKMGFNIEKVGKADYVLGADMIDEIEIVDQTPIGKSPRSNPISYIKTFDHIRDVFANTPQAKMKNHKPGFFSFNVPGGRCETCQGDGFIKVEMQFLADIYLECDDCKGTRYKKEVREITFRGKNLVEVLKMTVAEAIEFFKGYEKILKGLRALSAVGLDYLQLGQPSNTLSGGEAQRVKLANYISQQSEKKHTLFIFDEPTTGLHFDDIAKLIQSFYKLIETGNSVVIIEHNLDVIARADHIIDLGPEAGDDGGEVVITGTPQEVAACEKSWTGRYLKEMPELM